MEQDQQNILFTHLLKSTDIIIIILSEYVQGLHLLEVLPISFLFILAISRGVTIYQYIGISQYTKNIYRIAIPNAYRNISWVFFFLIKLFTFHLILVL